MGPPHLPWPGCPFVPGPVASLFFPSPSVLNSCESICSYQGWWLMQQLLLGQNSWNHTAITHAHSHARRRVVPPPRLHSPFPISGTKHSLTAQRARAAAQLAEAEMLMLPVKGWVTLWKLFRRVTLLVPFFLQPPILSGSWDAGGLHWLLPAENTMKAFQGKKAPDGSHKNDWSRAWLICWSPEKSFCLSWKHVILAPRLPFFFFFHLSIFLYWTYQCVRGNEK